MAQSRMKTEAAEAFFDEDVFFAEMPDEYRECRMDGHWRKTVGVYRVSRYVVHRYLHCERCGLEYAQVLNMRSGERIGSADTQYPEGYLAKGSGGISKASLRVNMLSELTIFDSWDDLEASMMNGHGTKNGAKKR